jgi:hypothetical protein
VSSEMTVEAVVSSLLLVLMPLFIVDADADVMPGALERAEAEAEVEVSVSHGSRRTLDGRKGHTMSSLRARVAGQPKRFLFTAKKPSTAAVPIYEEGLRGW